MAEWFTVGHSNRPLDEFMALLAENSVAVVVDVRKLAGSTRYPQFNADSLGDALAEEGVELRRLEGLTGRRPVSRTVPFEVNAWWRNRSFHNYADHALSDEFREDLATLLDWGRDGRCAVMCSEAVWWRCHRRIIADHLLAEGAGVTHILGERRTQRAEPSAGAVVGSDGRVVYPPTGAETTGAEKTARAETTARAD